MAQIKLSRESLLKEILVRLDLPDATYNLFNTKDGMFNVKITFDFEDQTGSKQLMEYIKASPNSFEGAKEEVYMLAIDCLKE